MDILDDFENLPTESSNWKKDPFEIYEYISEEQQTELMSLIMKCLGRRMPTNQYYKKISKFWRDIGEDEFADELLLKIEN
tara:strand:- start:1815 stop:2054 length:240 start_codon:yes stop_codon:yes gene_type:complete